jgi:hypothetical protein
MLLYQEIKLAISQLHFARRKPRQLKESNTSSFTGLEKGIHVHTVILTLLSLFHDVICVLFAVYKVISM